MEVASENKELTPCTSVSVSTKVIMSWRVSGSCCERWEQNQGVKGFHLMASIGLSEPAIWVLCIHSGWFSATQLMQMSPHKLNWTDGYWFPLNLKRNHFPTIPSLKQLLAPNKGVNWLFLPDSNNSSKILIPQDHSVSYIRDFS